MSLALAVLTGQTLNQPQSQLLTGLGFDLACFSSLSTEHLCIFGFHGNMFNDLYSLLYLLVS